jgi:hypothetical protein
LKPRGTRCISKASGVASAKPVTPVALALEEKLASTCNPPTSLLGDFFCAAGIQ